MGSVSCWGYHDTPPPPPPRIQSPHPILKDNLGAALPIILFDCFSYFLKGHFPCLHMKYSWVFFTLLQGRDSLGAALWGTPPVIAASCCEVYKSTVRNGAHPVGLIVAMKKHAQVTPHTSWFGHLKSISPSTKWTTTALQMSTQVHHGWFALVSLAVDHGV